MDLSTANTEALLRFHRSHEQLNRSIKVQVIGIGLLADEIDAGTPEEAIKQKLYARPGWLWGGMPDWTQPKCEVEAALRDIGQGGIIRAFSAFDLFLDETRGELDSWHYFLSENGMPGPTSDAADTVDSATDKVENFYQRHGATRVRISHLWAVYRYFRLARNCIAHREGIASRALVEAYAAPEIAPTLERWVERTSEMAAPLLVPIEEGKPVSFTHRQAIAASSTLRLIALDITQLVIDQLGEKGFVYIAARRAFFKSPPLPEALEMTSMVKTFNKVMANRYRVRSYDPNEGLRILRELGLTKQCTARFAEIKKQADALSGAIPPTDKAI